MAPQTKPAWPPEDDQQRPAMVSSAARPNHVEFGDRVHRHNIVGHDAG
jgi:hypothetical protein